MIIFSLPLQLDIEHELLCHEEEEEKKKEMRMRMIVLLLLFLRQGS